MPIDATSNNTESNVRKLEDYRNKPVDNSLGKDAFLRILAAQLSNQDPMEPASDTEFIAQLAQFSALEQMQSLNAGFTTSQAYSLVGKYVNITIEDETGSGAAPQIIFGKVDGVLKSEGINYVIVGGKRYKVEDVSGVMDASYVENSGNNAVQYTGNALDLSLDGEGYLVLSNGTTQTYTRMGNLHLDGNNNIVNSDGLFVQGFTVNPETGAVDTTKLTNIRIDEKYNNVVIRNDGRITGVNSETNKEELIGQVAVATFTSPAALEKISQYLYRSTTGSGQATLHTPGNGGAGSINPGTLEIPDTAITGDNLTDKILSSAGLIGKNVKATVTGEDGKPHDVTGTVSTIVIRNGLLYAKIGEQEVPVSDITEITLN